MPGTRYAAQAKVSMGLAACKAVSKPHWARNATNERRRGIREKSEKVTTQGCESSLCTANSNSHSHSHSLTYSTVRSYVGTMVSQCAERYYTVVAIFRTDRYGVQQGGYTGIAQYMASWRHWYRTVTSGTLQYTSVLSQSGLASVHCVLPDSVQVGTVCSEAATLVLHGTRPSGNTGIVP